MPHSTSPTDPHQAGEPDESHSLAAELTFLESLLDQRPTVAPMVLGRLVNLGQEDWSDLLRCPAAPRRSVRSDLPSRGVGFRTAASMAMLATAPSLVIAAPAVAGAVPEKSAAKAMELQERVADAPLVVQVIDLISRRPLAGVRIQNVAEEVLAITDARGQASLAAKYAHEPVLILEHDGYMIDLVEGARLAGRSLFALKRFSASMLAKESDSLFARSEGAGAAEDNIEKLVNMAGSTWSSDRAKNGGPPTVRPGVPAVVTATTPALRVAVPKPAVAVRVPAPPRPKVRLKAAVALLVEKHTSRHPVPRVASLIGPPQPPRPAVPRVASPIDPPLPLRPAVPRVASLIGPPLPSHLPAPPIALQVPALPVGLTAPRLTPPDQAVAHSEHQQASAFDDLPHGAKRSSAVAIAADRTFEAIAALPSAPRPPAARLLQTIHNQVLKVQPIKVQAVKIQAIKIPHDLAADLPLAPRPPKAVAAAVIASVAATSALPAAAKVAQALPSLVRRNAHPLAYRVFPGDMLSSIAQRELGSAALWPALYRANRDQLTNPRWLPVGLTLKIPRNLDTLAAQGGRVYTVGRGDTLSRIAQVQLGSAKRWRQIFAANRHQIRNPRLIFPGQRIILPMRIADAPPEAWANLVATNAPPATGGGMAAGEGKGRKPILGRGPEHELDH